MNSSFFGTEEMMRFFTAEAEWRSGGNSRFSSPLRLSASAVKNQRNFTHPFLVNGSVIYEI
jgi:hypothetical protein